jgi:hypothetical protein
LSAIHPVTFKADGSAGWNAQFDAIVVAERPDKTARPWRVHANLTGAARKAWKISTLKCYTGKDRKAEDVNKNFGRADDDVWELDDSWSGTITSAASATYWFDVILSSRAGADGDLRETKPSEDDVHITIAPQ